ncbi:hypothetical protein V2J09_006361 [Rumex salicifolius]
MASSRRTMPDEVIQCVIQYIHHPRDRDAISRVCRRWYELDSECRKHVTIAFCYSTTPDLLFRRFPHLESLKLKGKPRPAMFNLMPDYWGGYVTPWVNRLFFFRNLNSLHFRRMIVKDSDLWTISIIKGISLLSLKLDRCSGFSTDGLLHITRSCRNLRTLFLQGSFIEEKNGKWLHQLAINNKNLRILNFYLTFLDKINVEDIELIARNCPLVSLKIGGCEPRSIANIFSVATRLEEFTGGGYLHIQMEADNHPALPFPPWLLHLGLSYMRPTEMPLIFPVAHLLKTLDLLCALLSEEEICILIEKCLNLEVLVVRNVVGDDGLVTISVSCKKLKRLRIEQGEDEGVITQRGLIALSTGCRDLQYLAVYVSDITNEALQSIGANMKKLCDFRLVLLEREETISDLPLDNGVRALLVGCERLIRFALYLRIGGLSDQGLQYVGKYSQNIKWMLLGNLGESDQGLFAISEGCQSLQKLELRGCQFSERALAQAAQRMSSLKYMWVQGHIAKNGEELHEMARDNWYVEIIPSRQEIINVDGQELVQEHAEQVFAYYSLIGQRTDHPEDGSVVPLLLPPL